MYFKKITPKKGNFERKKNCSQITTLIYHIWCFGTSCDWCLRNRKVHKQFSLLIGLFIKRFSLSSIK